MNTAQIRALNRISVDATPLLSIYSDADDPRPQLDVYIEGYDNDDVVMIRLYCCNDTLVRYPAALGIRPNGALVLWNYDLETWIPCRLRWRYGNSAPCANAGWHRERYERICEAVYWTPQSYQTIQTGMR